MEEKRQDHLRIIQDNIAQVVENAGDETEQPLPPPQGIPHQWLPNWARKGVQWICLPIVLLDYCAQKIARLIIRPPFKRVGSCKRRGNCCHYVMMRRSRGILGVIERFWATQINGFYFRHQEPLDYEGRKVNLMGCRYLQKDGSCGNYRLRPMVCRNWPVIAHFGWPHILKGCGYRAEKTKVYDKLKG